MEQTNERLQGIKTLALALSHDETRPMLQKANLHRQKGEAAKWTTAMICLNLRVASLGLYHKIKTEIIPAGI